MTVKRHVKTFWGNGNVLNLTEMVFICVYTFVKLIECTLK